MTGKLGELKSDEAVAELFLANLNNLKLFEDLVLRYEQKLLRYVRSLGIEQNLAYDVVQESFIKAYRNIRSFNPKKGKWSSWLYRIAHNCAMDSFKKSKKDLTVDEDEWWEGISVPETISEELNIKLNNENLMAGLRRVDLKYREPLMLYYLENKSYKEIGDILRMPVPTVSTRIKRGKDRLRDVINEELKGKVKMEEVI